MTTGQMIFGSALIVAVPLLTAWGKVWLIERYRRQHGT